MKKSFFLIILILLSSLFSLALIFFLGVQKAQTPAPSKAASSDWSSPQNISNMTTPAYYPAIYTDSQNHSHILFGVDQGNDFWEVFYTNNTTGNFKTPVSVGGNYNFREKANITGLPNDPNHLFAVFQARRSDNYFDVIFIESTNGGITWSIPATITSEGALHRYAPDIAVAGEKIYVVFDSGNQSIGIIQRAITGGGWSQEISISNSLSNPAFPVITTTLFGKYLHVIFTAGPENGYELYYTNFDGNSWSPPKQLSNTPSSRKRSAIAGESSGKIFIFYSNGDTGPMITTASSDNGNTWYTSNQLSSLGEGNYPNVAIDYTGLKQPHMVWQQGFSGNTEVNYDLGQLPNSARGKNPDIAIGPSTINVVYHSDISGTYQIYFTRLQYEAQSPVLPPETAPDPTSCQGNTAAPAKCFDCKKDNTASSEINIFDFSCFTKAYGKKF